MHLYITTDAPYIWATFNSEQGNLIGQGQVESLNELNFVQSIEKTTLVANGSKVAAHKVTVPGSSKKNVISAIPYVLEEELTDDIEDLHFALQKWSSGEDSEVLVVDDEIVQAWLDKFAQAGYEVNDIVPEYFLLPRHPSADITLTIKPSGDYLIRSGDYSGSLIDESMIELWWDIEAKDKIIAINDEQMVKSLIEQEWENVQYWDIGPEFVDWIGHGGLKSLNTPCLLQGKYDDAEQKRARFDYKMAVNLLLAGVGIYLGALLANYAYLEFKSGQLENKATEIYQAAFPEFQDQQSENPLYDMRKAMSALRTGNYQSDNFLPILQVIANQLNTAPNTTLTNLLFEDNILSAQVSVADFASLESLLQKLAAVTQGYATVQSKDAVAQDNQVQGVLEVTLIRG